MSKFTNKRKIYISLIIWILVTFGMFWFGFDIFKNSNLNLTNQVLLRTKTYQNLLLQKESYEAGKKDLQTLAQKAYQPDDFFSKDTSLVMEIKALETLALKTNLQMKLEVTGTKTSAIKAETSSEIATIPYTLILTGTTANVLNYLQYMEHLGFVTEVRHIDMASEEPGKIKATLSAVFFIQK